MAHFYNSLRWQLMALLFSLCWLSGSSQTVLSQGDISIIGFNTNADERGIVFVTWVDLSAGTVIRFTDNGFNGSGSSTGAGNVRWQEQEVVWTTSSKVDAGTVIRITDLPPAATVGTVTMFNSDGSAIDFWGLSQGSGDQVFAYQRSGPMPAFSTTSTFAGTIITGMGYQGSGSNSSWLTSGSINTNSSYRPSDLVAPNHIYLAGNVTSGRYTGPRSGQVTLASYKSMVSNPANWSTASGSNVSSVSLTAFTAVGNVLPIHLSSGLKVNLQQQNILLSWTTSMEKDNLEFQIFRSDGREEYKKIGTIAGAGNSSEMAAYSYNDNSPILGTNYYRLVQVDYSGESRSVAEGVAVFGLASRSVLSLYPNPANSSTVVEFSSGRYDQAQLFTVSGKLIISVPIAPDQYRCRFALDKLPQGIYTVRLTGKGITDGIRLIKR